MTSHYTLMAIGRRRTYCPDLRFSNAHVLALRSRFRSSKYVFRHLAYMTIQPRPPLQGGQDGGPGATSPTTPTTTVPGRLRPGLTTGLRRPANHNNQPLTLHTWGARIRRGVGGLCRQRLGEPKPARKAPQ